MDHQSEIGANILKRTIQYMSSQPFDAGREQAMDVLNAAIEQCFTDERPVKRGAALKTWADVMSFIGRHKLPYNVVRFNMSLRGCLIDLATGDTLAETVKDAVAYLTETKVSAK